MIPNKSRRTQWPILLAIAALGLPLSACLTWPSPVPVAYDVALRDVQRPANAQQRYGQQAITQRTDSADVYRFTDSLIAANFRVWSNGISFDLENRTDTPIHILWTEAAFVDLFGQSQAVMHGGMKYTDCAATKAPSVIPPKQRLADTVLPCGYVNFTWGASSYLPQPMALSKDYAAVRDSLDRALKGKTIKLLLPIKNQDTANDYTFTFEVRGVRAP